MQEVDTESPKAAPVLAVLAYRNFGVDLRTLWKKTTPHITTDVGSILIK